MRTAALGARLHRRSLDRELACGIAAWRSPAHAASLDALLCDGAGPVYSPGGAVTLDNALTMAAPWLEAGE